MSHPQSEPTTEQRIIDFEQKISHHEMAIEELQGALHEQQLTIAKLEKALKHLTDRLDDAANGTPVGPGNEKPPHY